MKYVLILLLAFYSPRKVVKEVPKFGLTELVMFLPSKDIYPSESIYDVRVHGLKADSTMLVAMLINDECGYCSFEEKKAVAQVVKNRVQVNYNRYGPSYRQQIFAKQQFSGAMLGYSDATNPVKWYSPFNRFSSTYGNPKTGTRFKYVYGSIRCRENYRAAYAVLNKGDRVFEDNVVWFCKPADSTNKKFVDMMLKTQVKELEMVYSYDPNL